MIASSAKHIPLPTPHFAKPKRHRRSGPARMDPTDQSPEEVYSVWALPPEPVRDRLRGLMAGLRAAHGGPPFEPHATVVGAVRMRRPAAIQALRAAAVAAGVAPYTARVTGVARGDFFYQCVYLLLEPTPEVIQTSDHFCAHFGFQRSTPYMPHVSLLYGDLTDEEKEAARKKVEEMDSEISGLQFEISELALYRTDTEDKSLESWELVEVCHLGRK
ncbi:cyclic phosphodiesterase-like [Triticum dicoccoides]|uniref:cyclic phosphodiesterase-like n=1 Tax=Triticum dicoccoides TaxID=85692 RepID=UPI00188DCABB|nr:cyclic phosphodiesterase-like [Triticum dicoccoides]XP_037422599.1 cyclic phosphodiesterase-like [Triticum dicoccoides]